VSGLKRTFFNIGPIDQGGATIQFEEELSETTHIYRIDAFDQATEFSVSKLRDGNEANPMSATLELVYRHSDGSYQSQPENSAGGGGSATKQVTLDDPEEVLAIAKGDDAAEFDPGSADPADDGPRDGFINIDVQDVPIPSGIAGQPDIAAWSHETYLHTDVRLVLEIAVDDTGQVTEGTATPNEDFSLRKRLSGVAYSGQNSRPVGGQGDGSPLEISELSPSSLAGAKDGFRYYLVSDPGAMNWIRVAGNPSTGLWDKLEVIVRPVADEIPEGSESFTAYLETRVRPDQGESYSLSTELSEFISYGSVSVNIEDLPNGDAELESDGTCSCSCKSCAGGTPVDTQYGSFSEGPKPASSSYAMINPIYHSRGPRSNESTVRAAFNFGEIEPRGVTSPALPNSVNVRINVQSGTLTESGTDSRTSIITSIGESGPQQDGYALNLNLPDGYGSDNGEQSIAVRL
ncbi:MAG: hypothetical protein AAFN70_14530, partial [Planctomycetota bacterium]